MAMVVELKEFLEDSCWENGLTAICISVPEWKQQCGKSSGERPRSQKNSRISQACD